MPRHSRSYDPFGDAAFDVTVTGMLPGRPYRWRARVAYGEASGPWSEWTASFTTGTNGAPPAIEGLSAALVPRAGAPPGAPGLAHVVVPRQTDDGGDPIVGILVRAHHADGAEPRTKALQHVVQTLLQHAALGAPDKAEARAG